MVKGDGALWLDLKIRRGFSEEEITKSWSKEVELRRRVTDKRNSICKSHKDEELSQGMGLWKPWGEWNKKEAKEMGNARWWRLEMVIWEMESLWRIHEESDRTSSTRPVVCWPPLFLFSLLQGSPYCWGESGGRVTIPILSQAVQLPLIVFLQFHCHPSIAFPATQALPYAEAPQPHYLPSSSLQIRYW